jgi:hypothetical protein
VVSSMSTSGRPERPGFGTLQAYAVAAKTFIDALLHSIVLCAASRHLLFEGPTTTCQAASYPRGSVLNV